MDSAELTESESARSDGVEWNELAGRWLDHADELERFAAPLGELALAQLRLRPGEHVLDVGCGAGRSTAAIARLVGPAGRAVGVDIAPAMVRHARRIGNGEAALEFLVADAENHHFGERFDAVFSRFGLMFFADPPAAFANLRSALRPQGRLGFVSWADIRTNDWFMITGRAVLAATGVPPAGARREPFSLADPDQVRALLAGAGFLDIRITTRIETANMTEAELEQRLRTSTQVTGLRETLQRLDPDTRQQALRSVREALWGRLRDGTIALRVGVLVVTAAR